MFRPPAAPAPDPWQLPQGGGRQAPFPNEPGQTKAPQSSADFDRFFENPYESNQGAMEAKLRPDAPSFQDRPGLREEGDFTHLFGGKNEGSAGPPIGATGVFAGPQVPLQPAASQGPIGPSEYTQWMKRPSAAAPAAPAAAAASAAAAPALPVKKGPNWILIALIAVAVLLVIGIVVLLVMNK